MSLEMSCSCTCTGSTAVTIHSKLFHCFSQGSLCQGSSLVLNLLLVQSLLYLIQLQLIRLQCLLSVFHPGEPAFCHESRWHVVFTSTSHSPLSLIGNHMMLDMGLNVLHGRALLLGPKLKAPEACRGDGHWSAHGMSMEAAGCPPLPAPFRFGPGNSPGSLLILCPLVESKI